MSIPSIPAHRMSVSDVALAAHPATDTPGVQQPIGQSSQQVADRIASDWNAVNASIGSFAEEYVAL